MGKRKNKDSYVKNDKFPKRGEYPLSKARMLNILQALVWSYAKIKCNIITCKPNVYKTFTK